MDEGISDIITAIGEWEYGWMWLLAGLAMAWLIATVWYGWRLKETRGKINLGRISIKGKVAEGLRHREIGLIVCSHLMKIYETFQSTTWEHNNTIYTVEAVTAEFPCIDKALTDVMFDIELPEIKVAGSLAINIGPVEIPAGALINLFMALFHWLPVPFRKQYLDSLIHISLVSVGDEVQLLIYKRDWQQKAQGDLIKGEERQAADKPLLLCRTRSVGSLTEFIDLLEEAAFMILEMQGSFEGRKSLSMKYFTDGIRALDEYRHTNKEELLDTAKERFAAAAAADWDNYHALYFYASMLLMERTEETIARASTLFTQALKTEKFKLGALVNNGLANCYIQQFHRLARREKDVRKKIDDHVGMAVKLWEMAPGYEEMHPLILKAQALAGIVDEGAGLEQTEKKRKFVDAVLKMIKAIEMQPDNGMFHNILGWILMKMAHCGESSIGPGDGLPDGFSGNPAELAEKHLRIALDLNPRNKLSHANLCLLYASPHYLAKGEEHLDRCRYHGLMAVKIDPEYINGFRDLAVSLLRYGEVDEAYQYFEKALLFAKKISKDLEIISDVKKVLDQELKIREKNQRKWLHPDTQLLIPPDE